MGTEIDMKEIGEMVSDVVKVSMNTQMVMYMKDNGLVKKEMVQEFKSGQMVVSMKVSGNIICHMDAGR